LSKKIVIDYDPETKTKEVMHLDGTGQAVIEAIQDVESSLEFNAFMATSTIQRRSGGS
jgi:hypothetical protein